MYSLVIQNNSQFNINCRWNLSSGCLKRGGAEKQLVNVKPLERVIAAHSQRKCELIFAPATSQSLKNSELTLYVSNMLIYIYIILYTYVPMFCIPMYQFSIYLCTNVLYQCSIYLCTNVLYQCSIYLCTNVLYQCSIYLCTNVLYQCSIYLCTNVLYTYVSL